MATNTTIDDGEEDNYNEYNEILNKLMNKFLMENTTIDDGAEDIDNNYNEILNNNNNGESNIKGVSPLYIYQ